MVIITGDAKVPGKKSLHFSSAERYFEKLKTPIENLG